MCEEEKRRGERSRRASQVERKDKEGEECKLGEKKGEKKTEREGMEMK